MKTNQQQKPITKEQAQQTIDGAVRQIMRERGVGYPQAFQVLCQEHPDAVSGYRYITTKDGAK